MLPYGVLWPTGSGDIQLQVSSGSLGWVGFPAEGRRSFIISTAAAAVGGT